jgi:pheromone shutdown protein TraB
LRNATAIVKVADNTEVYILGISHVSKVSVRHIQDLISAVQPDTVAVELCRDRTGLLIPENAPPPQRFHAPSVTITGYMPPKDTTWPTVQQLKSRLKSEVQGSVSASEIEEDVAELLSTGLFRTVRPVTKPCGPNGAPTFMFDPSATQKNQSLVMVAPLGQINFLVTMKEGQVPPSATATTQSASIDKAQSNLDSVEIEKWSERELASGIQNFDSLRSGSSSQRGSSSGGSSSGGGGGGGLADSFARVLTQQYAQYQAAAGRSVGIGTGAAWQAALHSAAECGAQQVYLVDRPASVTGRRLAQGIWKSHSPLLLGAVPAAIAGAAITSSVATDTLQAGVAPVVFAILLPFAAALWPIAAPLLEIQKFSKMSGEQIEEAVSIKEPLQSSTTSEIVALYGEDALIKWPGAMNSIISERDEYMAAVLAAIATSTAQGLTPAYVRSSENSSVYYRYAMPKGDTDPRVCPIGDGDGRFDPTLSSVKKIVAVVGTAHVRGMLKLWPRISQPGSDLSLSKFVE